MSRDIFGHSSNHGLGETELVNLLEISRVVNSPLPMDTIFKVVHAYLKYLIASDVEIFYIKEGLEYVVVPGLGVSDDFLPLLNQFVKQDFLLRRIKATRRGWRATQFLDAEKIRRHQFYKKVLRPMQVFYVMGVPILVNNVVSGSIHLARSERTGDFTARELKILEVVANVLAAVVQNSAIRKYQVWDMENLCSKGRNDDKEGRKKQDEDYLNMLGVLSSMVVRELRNPLANLKMAFYSVAQRVATGSLVEADLEEMELALNRMDKTVTFLNNLSGDITLKTSMVNVNNLLDETLELLGPSLDPEVNVIKDYSSVPPLPLDKGKMMVVFGNVIRNAVETMLGGGTLRIITSYNNGMVYVILEDNGLWTEQSGRPHPFESLSGSNPDQVGLGLALCKRIVESHGGSIKVRTNIGKGNAICINMPLKE